MKKGKVNEEVSSLSSAVEWSKRHPVKAGIIGVSGILLAKAVGIKRVSKFITTTGITKAAMQAFKSV